MFYGPSNSDRFLVASVIKKKPPKRQDIMDENEIGLQTHAAYMAPGAQYFILSSSLNIYFVKLVRIKYIYMYSA